MGFNVNGFIFFKSFKAKKKNGWHGKFDYDSLCNSIKLIEHRFMKNDFFSAGYNFWQNIILHPLVSYFLSCSSYYLVKVQCLWIHV